MIRKMKSSVLFGLLSTALFASAVSTRADGIRVQVQIRGVSADGFVTFTLQNDEPDRLIAWEVKAAIEYPDGYRTEAYPLEYCHAKHTAADVAACEIEPGAQQVQRYLIPLRNGQPAAVTNASVQSTILERGSDEKYQGDQRWFERVRQKVAERQQGWTELLVVLKGLSSEGPPSGDVAEWISARLDRDAPSNVVAKRVRVELEQERALKARPGGRASGRNSLERLLYVAERESSFRPHDRE